MEYKSKTLINDIKTMEAVFKVILLLLLIENLSVVYTQNIVENNNFRPEGYLTKNFYPTLMHWESYIIQGLLKTPGNFFISSWFEEVRLTSSTTLLFLKRNRNADYKQKLILTQGDYQIKAFGLLKNAQLPIYLFFKLCRIRFKYLFPANEQEPKMHLLGNLKRKETSTCFLILEERVGCSAAFQGNILISNFIIEKQERAQGACSSRR